MKRTFRLIVEIDDGTLSAHSESDNFHPVELGVIFGKLAQVSVDMKNHIQVLGAETAAEFDRGFACGLLHAPPDGSFIGTQEAKT